jgi:hypothetical protein
MQMPPTGSALLNKICARDSQNRNRLSCESSESVASQEIAIIVCGVSAVVVGAGLIGAARQRLH